MSDEWPAPPPTLTNTELAAPVASSTMVPMVATADRSSMSGQTQEEPALRLAPPVPIPRRASVDVVGLAKRSSAANSLTAVAAAFSLEDASTLPANQSLSSASTDPEFLFSAVCFVTTVSLYTSPFLFGTGLQSCLLRFSCPICFSIHYWQNFLFGIIVKG